MYRILEPAFRLDEQVRVIIREDRSAEGFMGELAMHAVDVVISDAPAAPGTSVRAFNHPLGECGTTFFATPELAKTCRRQFPRSLDGVRFLMPSTNSTLRRALEEWFNSLDIRPNVVAEIEDLALVKVVGEAGFGVFAAPDVIEKDVLQRYEVQVVGREALRHRFYAISLERKIRHPAVVAISEKARKEIFV